MLREQHCWEERGVTRDTWRTHLHERDEQEEGVGRPPDLLVQEAGQKGKYAIFGGTAAKHTETKDH